MARGLEIDNWTAQLRKGVLEVCILRSLQEEELYAYDLVKRLSVIPGLVVSEGTIYPLLSRLRKQGWITARLEESTEGPVRKYYRLTPEGGETLAMMIQCWHDLAAGVNQTIEKGV